ncbi:glyoxylate/hydroxypyruvate reductase B-like [Hyla sarda]|uniref:glyoxylate/hydroxypyruvate reductase B-like n=1 Tax=Hyla sarda TaxID=327740 RepID=UPI0024C432CE|nr:glyoxylate/hydroxypyruvate reductase B-like [Hyla sarda]XP_056377332.1 glyoxylate/hydroxypyruvate reductase B-like [Hyla sarda]XP_056377333.1 glyoxylate/hydroxypyruvate reductase B-like [Hyla sarda]XP_056377334.1 glyoxylate/hydroxypyruvate reductase B-like [Hyla sarda]XP_056377335.1 glyoxylate/hydroxypyruvate reductase B-like [Hyla sarda]XP_056377336.1 glyoxylate/hydroxypyruvate reductase B-like [Hyla sarda]
MEELPYALMSHSGGSRGFPKNYETIVKKHFQILYMEEYSKNKNVYAPKIQALLLWWHLPILDKQLLDSLPNLKVIASSGAGVDHLDLKLIKSYGILVSNTPGVGNDSTADMGMTLMLASAKNVVKGNTISCSSDTKEFDFNWVGDDITEATLGIIGMGSIGYCIAQRAKAFRMRILYHNRNRRTLEEEAAVGAEYCSNMTDLLQRSDFVMVVVTLTPETHNLIGKEELQFMKPTATLINISRGQVIDQDALAEALNKGIIKAAALDVTHPEPLPRNHPLLTAKNIIVTPHIGNATDKTRRRVAEKIVQNASAMLKGLPVKDIVTAP